MRTGDGDDEEEGDAACGGQWWKRVGRGTRAIHTTKQEVEKKVEPDWCCGWRRIDLRIRGSSARRSSRHKSIVRKAEDSPKPK